MCVPVGISLVWGTELSSAALWGSATRTDEIFFLRRGSGLFTDRGSFSRILYHQQIERKLAFRHVSQNVENEI